MAWDGTHSMVASTSEYQPQVHYRELGQLSIGEASQGPSMDLLE